MRVAFIGCSNLKYMPYMSSYIEWINSEANLEIIYWNRFNIEEKCDFKNHMYLDNKVGHKRNSIDYFKYVKYVRGILRKNKYDLIIISTIQLYFFIRTFAKDVLKTKFILDFRDDHKLSKFVNKRELINKTECLIVSSNKYKAIFPDSSKVIVHHNINLVNKIPIKTDYFKSKPIKINSIGATRDIEANKILISKLKNNDNYYLNYHGEGIANKPLKEYVSNENIVNTKFTGSYNPEEMEILYLESDFVNVVRLNDSFNNYAALPNRLYQAMLYKKPLIALPATFLSEIIEKYQIGLVLNTDKDISKQIENYLDNFQEEKFQENSDNFLKDIMLENQKCQKEIQNLISRLT